MTISEQPKTRYVVEFLYNDNHEAYQQNFELTPAEHFDVYQRITVLLEAVKIRPLCATNADIVEAIIWRYEEPMFCPYVDFRITSQGDRGPKWRG